ncbi:MAG: sugar ABC transporter permease [Chloroflexi bacterium HGW-Chloroflexi-10]|nr:MAG: sugar ABC transporter permease [Chloroflexi bacterium HGW-Chloroflexi-10]
MSTIPIKKSFSWLGKSMHAREVRLAWFLILPTAIIVFGLILFPAVFSIWISFHKVGLHNLNDVINAPFNGWDNYRAVFSDFAFKWGGAKQWGAAVTTVVYSFISTFLTLIAGLAAAMLLNRPFRGRGLIRSVFLFPYVAPVISIAFVWRWLLDPRPSGVFNHILMSLGLIDTPQAFLATRGLTIWLVILIQAWRYFPFAMLMILARLQAVDDTLYEAAAVDGASAMQKFRFITMPELRYVLGAIFLLRLLWTFNKFDDIWLLTGGGYGTNVLPVLTFQFSFNMFDFGKGAATAMIMLAALVVFIVAYVLIIMRNAEEN